MLTLTKVLTNSFMLFIPIHLWNLLLASKLIGKIRLDNPNLVVPCAITTLEIFFRFVVFTLPIFMHFDFTLRKEKIGFILYSAGIVVYFLSWIPHLFPIFKGLRKRLLFFIAPALTPIIWLIGIGLMSKPYFNFINLPMGSGSEIYCLTATIFVFFHCAHVTFAFLKLE
ncbi:MAG: hypothetical protein HQK53_13625 [Oligoflexia bacterium]|nr:hypothetical protein [Oligoflexia bacterium]